MLDTALFDEIKYDSVAVRNKSTSDFLSGSESIGILNSFGIIDSGTGFESGNFSNSFNLQDLLSGSDILSITNVLQLQDSASVYEIISALNSLELNDFLSGSDFIDIGNLIQNLLDSATGSEIVSVINDIRIQDNATVSETIGILTALSVVDELIGIDRIFAGETPQEVAEKMKVLLSKMRGTDLNKDALLLNKTRETTKLNKNKLNKNKNREVKLD